MLHYGTITGNRDLLRRLHESPEDFIEHLRHLAGAITMEVKKDSAPIKLVT
jgi:hypothetical protein